MSSPPVTVSITRSVDPGRISEVTRWVQNGVNLANTWPGFLGSGWVRASAASTEWHMLYRFSNETTLGDWETSDQRAEWLRGGHGLVEERQVSRRTGIEGWFDAPAAHTEFDDAATDEPTLIEVVRPPRWKQATSIWLGFFPVNLVFTLAVTTLVPGWNDLMTLAKVAITCTVLTPLMAYWVLPFVTRLLQPWLTRPVRATRIR